MRTAQAAVRYALAASQALGSVDPKGSVIASLQRLKNARSAVDRGAWDEGSKILDELITTASTVSDEAGRETFQQRVQPWLMTCFGEKIAGDCDERNHRFFEESLELAQTCGCSVSEAHQLVDYVYGRPVGESAQEVGGVMVTLAALCLASDLNMHDAAEVELARIWTKVEAIRAKQAAKPKHSPLPRVVDAWQAIETAPKDDTVIDLWRPDDSAAGGERLVNMFRVELSGHNVFYDPIGSGETCVRDATYWMPLPATPYLLLGIKPT